MTGSSSRRHEGVIAESSGVITVCRPPRDGPVMNPSWGPSGAYDLRPERSLAEMGGLTMAGSVQSRESINTGPDLELYLVRRAAAVVGLGGIALVHVLDLQGKLDELPYVGVMFIGLIGASLLLAEALIRSDDARAWLAAGALAAATIVGYGISRTAGLPGDHDSDVGNWLEPLGLASLLVEGVVVLLAVARLMPRR